MFKIIYILFNLIFLNVSENQGRSANEEPKRRKLYTISNEHEVPSRTERRRRKEALEQITRFTNKNKNERIEDNLISSERAPDPHTEQNFIETMNHVSGISEAIIIFFIYFYVFNPHYLHTKIICTQYNYSLVILLQK